MTGREGGVTLGICGFLQPQAQSLLENSGTGDRSPGTLEPGTMTPGVSQVECHLSSASCSLVCFLHLLRVTDDLVECILIVKF